MKYMYVRIKCILCIDILFCVFLYNLCINFWFKIRNFRYKFYLYVEIINQNEGISLFDDFKMYGFVLILLYNLDIDFVFIVVNNL